ncbi:MAG: hypothetical protein M3P49_11380 [Actinomycetota bacterium]|nr:hypothetical protein [Actinomycetota bacterium]
MVYLTRVEGKRQDIEVRGLPHGGRRIDEDMRRSLRSGRPVYLRSGARKKDVVFRAVGAYARFVPVERKLTRLIPE